MTIIIPTDDNINFQTYSGLKESIASRLDRSFVDSDLTDFIYLAGLELERVLLVPYREDSVNIEITGATSPLPSDFKALTSATLQTDPKRNLQQVTPAVLDSNWPDSSTGVPESFAIVGDEMWFAPAPDGTYTVGIVYQKKITPLTDDSPSNWVLVNHPDAYFYGALVQAVDFISDQARIGLYRNAFDNVITQINDEGNRWRYSASPLRLRSPVCV